MSLELDKRIKAITDIQSVTSILNNLNLDKKGYFSDRIAEFKDLSKCMYGEFVEYREHEQCFLCEIDHYDGTFDHTYYRYFLPEDSLLPEEKPEKKYRPYTVMEFIKEYPLGSHLHFRPKDKTIEMHRLIDGYNDCLNGAGTLFMCGGMYSMRELYDNYDVFKDGEWQPFGVMEDD